MKTLRVSVFVTVLAFASAANVEDSVCESVIVPTTVNHPIAINTPKPAPIAAYEAPPATISMLSPSALPSSIMPGPSASSPLTPSGRPTGGLCGEIGGTCSGEMTVYNATGVGACGWLSNSIADDVFALAYGMMGTQSNGNPYCGRRATITLNGTSATGKLVDKCPSCYGQSIDLSDHLFAALGGTDRVGRYYNVMWRFIS